MTWFKVDDGFYAHPKVLAASLPAVGLWVRAGAWCAQQLADGRLPRAAVALVGGTPELAEELVAIGLWDRTDDGYAFHDWDDYQPSKSDVIDRRAKTAERVRRHREKVAAGNGVTNAAETPPPTRPVPTPPESPNGDSVAARGTRIPATFSVSEAMREWAMVEAPGVNVEAATATFIDYWRAKAGRDATKRDWEATWRVWLRRDAERIAPRSAGRAPTVREENFAFAMSLDTSLREVLA